MTVMAAGDEAGSMAARAAAISTIIEAIEQAARVLESYGRPGIDMQTGKGCVRPVDGWLVEFGRPAAPPPGMLGAKPPLCRCRSGGRWHTGVFDEGRLGEVVLTFTRGDEVTIGTRQTTGFTDYDRGQWVWRLRSPREHAEDLLTDRAVWLCDCRPEDREAGIAANTDPQVYRRFVSEVAEAVGAGFECMTETRLSRLDEARRNREARVDAIAQMVAAIEQTYAALELSGRPGIGPVEAHPSRLAKPGPNIVGWRVPLRWAGLTVPAPAVTPPPMRRQVGNWGDTSGDRSDFDHVALTSDGQVAVSWPISPYKWQVKSPREYVEWMLLDWFVWWSSDYRPTTFLMADHTEPAGYIPYVQAIAEIVVNGFRSIGN